MKRINAVAPEPDASGKIAVELPCGQIVILSRKKWTAGRPLKRHCPVCGITYDIMPMPREWVDAITSRLPAHDHAVIVLVALPKRFLRCPSGERRPTTTTIA